MRIELGNQPHELVVTLSRYTDFVCTLVSAEPWPVGSKVELQFTRNDTDLPIVWLAAINGTTATFNKSMADSLGVLTSRATRARMIYTDQNDNAILWARGQVRVF